MAGLYWNEAYMNAWSGLCDLTPANETSTFNVRAILTKLGVPQGSHDGFIKKFEGRHGKPEDNPDDRGDRIVRVGPCKWKWDFESTRHPERFV